MFEIAEQLLIMDAETTEPRELPGRYGRVVRDLERLLRATATLSVVAGGWAVWRHGFAGRVTEDVDIVVPLDRLEALLMKVKQSTSSRIHLCTGFAIRATR